MNKYCLLCGGYHPGTTDGCGYQSPIMGHILRINLVEQLRKRRQCYSFLVGGGRLHTADIVDDEITSRRGETNE